MDIAPDGTVLSACDHFAAILSKKGIPEYIGGNFLDLFSRIGKTGIHWILSPQHPSGIAAGGWQLTGIIEIPAGDTIGQPTDELATHVSRDGKLSYLITAIRYGFFVLDNHFKVKLWNHEAERLTHLPAAEMVGRSIWEMIPEWSDKHIRQSFHQAFNNKMTVTVEQYYERSDSWLEMSLYPSDQEMFAYFRDVTPQKKQEALLVLEKKVLVLNTGKRMSLQSLLNLFLKGILDIFPGMYCMVQTSDQDLPIGPAAGSLGLLECWSIPVVNDHDEVLAAFSVYYTTAKVPTGIETDIFERVANLVTLLIQCKKAEEDLLRLEVNKQKLIAQAMVDAQEKERAEIGKELHDNINQILSTTKLYLELAKSDNKERINLITRSAGNIHNAIREIRNISRSLVPASIGDLGLIDSLTDLVESIQLTRAIQVEFYPQGNFDERLSDKTKLMLFRIIQEQIDNVIQHSGAQKLIIALILEETEDRIDLCMTDDGKGFNPEKVGKEGLGLSNIRSRAGLFGGKMTIQSAPGRGCKLSVQVPVL
jgi:PAS domain S-box-containing protein